MMTNSRSGSIARASCLASSLRVYLVSRTDLLRRARLQEARSQEPDTSGYLRAASRSRISRSAWG